MFWPDDYLDQVARQVRVVRIREPLTAELKDHMLSQKADYMAAGLSEDEAERRTTEDMGDALLVGGELDAAHRPAPQWKGIAITMLLLALGLGIQVVNGMLTGCSVMDTLVGARAIFTAFALAPLCLLALTDYTHWIRWSLPIMVAWLICMAHRLIPLQRLIAYDPAIFRVLVPQVLWAARLSVKDDSYQRRRWVYNMSIVQTSDEEISFYYAKCYQDHMAGSLKSPRERPKTKDMLPEILFNSLQITCMIGRYAYPRAPIVLDDYSLNDVMDIIMDPDRPIPIMLITCPDVVSPETIFDMTKGNLIVACCDDTRLVIDLNAGLPKNLYTQWDSIHILMPLSDSRAYHPTYTYSDIRSMGIDTFMDGIRQAFCESLRSKEKHAFFTVEDVEKCRNRGQANQLAQTCEEQKDKMREMEERLAKQDEQIEGLLSQLQEVSNRSKEITEYEEMIDESMAECSDLKRGISDLTTQMYASLGDTFHPNEQEPLAILQELSHAIFVAMACVAEKR